MSVGCVPFRLRYLLTNQYAAKTQILDLLFQIWYRSNHIWSASRVPVHTSFFKTHATLGFSP